MKLYIWCLHKFGHQCSICGTYHWFLLHKKMYELEWISVDYYFCKRCADNNEVE